MLACLLACSLACWLSVVVGRLFACASGLVIFCLSLLLLACLLFAIWCSAFCVVASGPGLCPVRRRVGGSFVWYFWWRKLRQSKKFHFGDLFGLLPLGVRRSAKGTSGKFVLPVRSPPPRLSMTGVPLGLPQRSDGWVGGSQFSQVVFLRHP